MSPTPDGRAVGVEVEQYLADRVRQPYPDGCHVVPGSLPVVSFGDVRSAWVVTVSLNPSSSEFLDKRGTFLEGREQRFETIESLGIATPELADDAAVRRVLEACYGYFRGTNPYWTWFRPLERILDDSLGASYRDGTAAHLDLVQWATDPVWGRIRDKQVRRRLIEGDRQFLGRQLANEGIRLVLVNGATAMKQLEPLGVDFQRFGLPQVGKSKFVIRRGYLDDVLVVGWNKVANGGGMSKEQRELLVSTIRCEAAILSPHANGKKDAVGVPKDTNVTTKTELVQLLREWLATGEETIGDTTSFGGRPWIHVDLGGVRVNLNADTKRAAVQAYLDYVEAEGAESPWAVIANQGVSKKVNKVVYRSDRQPSTGWFGYTEQEQEPGTVI